MAALKILRDEVSTTDVTELSVVCGQIQGLYTRNKEKLDAAWGEVKLLQLSDREASPPTSPTLRESQSPPRFVSQGEPKEVDSLNAPTFDELQRHFGVTLDFPKAGLNGHGGRIEELFNRESPVQLDFEIFCTVFTALKGAPVNTIEGQIRVNFVAYWRQLCKTKNIPFSFSEANQVNKLLGSSRISHLTETYSMLGVEVNFYTDRYPTLGGYSSLIKDLFDGEANPSTPGAPEAIAAALRAIKDTQGDLDPAFKIRAKLESLLPARVGRAEKTDSRGRKGSPDSFEGRTLAQTILMAGAVILTIYLANRYVVQPTLQWYRGRTPQV